MSSPEVPDSPEKMQSPWREVFEILSHIAKDKLSDHGRKISEGAISRQFLFRETGLKARVESPDVNSWFIVTLKPSRNNSEKDDLRPPKGINLEWATGENTNYHQATFTVSRLGVVGYGLPLSNGEEVKLRLLNSPNAARQFEDIAKITIDQGKLPHLFS